MPDIMHMLWDMIVICTESSFVVQVMSDLIESKMKKNKNNSNKKSLKVKFLFLLLCIVGTEKDVNFDFVNMLKSSSFVRNF